MNTLALEASSRLDCGELGLVWDPAALARAERGRDAVIAALATRQYGVVSRAQLLAAGIGPGAIATRMKRHGLIPLHRGVYAVGHTALVPLAREAAALLAGGPAALLSHRSAAWLWRLVERRVEPVEITVPASSRRRPGLIIHRSRGLGPDDVSVRRGLPATTPARTLLDLATVSTARELERALDEAFTQRVTSRAALRAAVQRAQGHHGAGRVRALLAGNQEPALTRSEAEERFLGLLRDAALPPPAVNAKMAGHVVDFLWRERGLIVEIDGFRFHSTRSAFERDRRRDAELTAAGFRVLRVTWRQLCDEPFVVIARLAAALAV